MCHHCEHASRQHKRRLGRRAFLKLTAAAAVGLAACKTSVAAPLKAAPKPENVLSPEAALERLMKGNARYVAGLASQHDFRNEREALTKGQNPFAGILGCADSRVVPEFAFDAGRGDLSVCRVAGNVIDDDVIASFEYAVSVLSAPLLMVLGHQGCGAVDAALKSVKDGTTPPGHLPSLVNSIRPAVNAVLDRPGSALDNAIKENVILNVEKMKTTMPILSQYIGENKVRVVGAVYNLENGRVELV